MEAFVQFLIAIMATISFAILFSAPVKELFFCGLTGGVGWIVYYLLKLQEIGIVPASFIATICLTLIARILAVRRHNPVTVYLLTGIFALVPGAGIYYTSYYLFTDQMDDFIQTGIITFETAWAIVFGIVFGFAIPQKLFTKLQKK